MGNCCNKPIMIDKEGGDGEVTDESRLISEFKTKRSINNKMNNNYSKKTDRSDMNIENEKKNVIYFTKCDDFIKGSRVKDMKKLLERGCTHDEFNTTAPILEESKTFSNFNYLGNNSFINDSEENKNHKTKTNNRKGSMKIYYMARALEEKLNNTRNEELNINDRVDKIAQIMLEKPTNQKAKKINKNSLKVNL